MSDEIAKLKAELEALNLQCQLARDHEIRYALQRTRLEAERIQLMLKIVDAVASPPEAVPPSHPLPAAMRKSPPAPAADATRREQKPAQRQKRKPDGLPTVAEMVFAILEGEEVGMRPRDIAKIARRKWWPGLRGAAVNAVVWKLAGKGRLEKDGRLYRLNGHAGE
jgi:hypothetical protein